MALILSVLKLKGTRGFPELQQRGFFPSDNGERWIRDLALAYSMKCRIKSKCVYNTLPIHYQSSLMLKTFFLAFKSFPKPPF